MSRVTARRTREAFGLARVAPRALASCVRESLHPISCDLVPSLGVSEWNRVRIRDAKTRAIWVLRCFPPPPLLQSPPPPPRHPSVLRLCVTPAPSRLAHHRSAIADRQSEQPPSPCAPRSCAPCTRCRNCAAGGCLSTPCSWPRGTAQDKWLVAACVCRGSVRESEMNVCVGGREER